MILFNHIFGIGKHEVTVCFQMYQSVRLQELPVAVHKICRSQTFGSFLHLRIRECQPNLAHFTRSKETIDNLNVCP